MHSIATAQQNSEIAGRVADVRARINDAIAAAGRDPATVTLIAVSKTQSAAAVKAAAAAGIKDFGENYLQEAVQKINDCADLGVNWHYIGAIQSNKTRLLAEHFHWIHTVDRPKIARRLNDQCPDGRRLNVCLQVNVDRDPNKAGVLTENAGELVDAVAAMENLALRGLMTILHQESDPVEGYRQLAALFHQLADRAGANWDSLSMGMSADYQSAIRAGATHVRVGTAIFGPRRQPEQTQQESH